MTTFPNGPSMHTPSAYSTSTIRDEAHAFASSAEALARLILGTQATPSTTSNSTYAAPGHTTVVHHHTHSTGLSFWDYWWLSRPSQTVIVNPCPAPATSYTYERRNERKKNNDTNVAGWVILGAAAVGAGIYAAYQRGVSQGKFNNINDELRMTREFKERFKMYSGLAPADQLLVNAAIKAAEMKERLCLHLANSATEDWQNNGLVLGGAATTIGSAVVAVAEVAALASFAVPAAIAGAAALGFGGIRMLIKSGVDSTYNHRLEAEALLAQAALVKSK